MMGFNQEGALEAVQRAANIGEAIDILNQTTNNFPGKKTDPEKGNEAPNDNAAVDQEELVSIWV